MFLYSTFIRKGKVRRMEMLIKITSKNQITLPKKVLAQISDTEYFDVDVKDGKISLAPLTLYDTELEKVRTRMKKLGLKSTSVAEAIKWARSR
jgi:hypothetical protein